GVEIRASFFFIPFTLAAIVLFWPFFERCLDANAVKTIRAATRKTADGALTAFACASAVAFVGFRLLSAIFPSPAASERSSTSFVGTVIAFLGILIFAFFIMCFA
ncbi:MAG: hypothetical protein LBJ76_07200, partial [Candidatus Accumulibacter sp.]|nr:hypothetical protein [Accumulibacter sp.]